MEGKSPPAYFIGILSLSTVGNLQRAPLSSTISIVHDVGARLGCELCYCQIYFIAGLDMVVTV